MVRGVQFRVLGPVEVESAGDVLILARRQERYVLAILLLEPGRVVPIDRLCDLIWEENPPTYARRGLQSSVARIRAMLARAGAATDRVALHSRGGGYVLDVDPDTVDAHRFRLLVAEVGGVDDPRRKDKLLREALALWRGPALHDAATDRTREQLCADLDELRLHATEESMAAGLALCRHRELVPELARLTAIHPIRERLVELHMTALQQAGRSGEALEVFTRARRILGSELGLGPGSSIDRPSPSGTSRGTDHGRTAGVEPTTTIGTTLPCRVTSATSPAGRTSWPDCWLRYLTRTMPRPRSSR